MSHLKYADAKYVFLTDFDGTITLLVSHHHLHYRRESYRAVVTMEHRNERFILLQWECVD